MQWVWYYVLYIIYQYAVNMVLYTSMQCSLVFRANRSFFMSKGAICSWKRVNRSHCSLKKSNRAKSNGSILLLGTKRGKAVKNIQKNTNLFEWIARFLRAICLNHEQITHVALFKRVTRAIISWSLICKEGQEQIAHTVAL